MNPVSYTHLDVYKRQADGTGATGLVDHVDRLAKVFFGFLGQGTQPVSYTHLDVYKRQDHAAKKRSE